MATFTGMEEKFAGNMENYRDEVKKRLPEGVSSAMDNLQDEIAKMTENRNEIFDRYINACQEQDIGPEQAKDELEMYIKKKVPAAELLAPVGICRELRDGLDGMDDFDPFAD